MRGQGEMLNFEMAMESQTSIYCNCHFQMEESLWHS